MPDHRHSALDDFLRDYTDRRADELPKELTLPESNRERLLETVRKGIPQARPRRRRTEYEDELEEKRITRQSPRRGETSAGRRVFFGFALRFLAGAAALVMVAGIALWWMDRSSYNEADLAGASAPKPSTNNLASGADFFAPTPRALPTPATPSATGPAAGAEEPTATAPATAAAPAASRAVKPVAPATAVTADGNEYAQFAALAAAVPIQANGVRLNFEQLPAALQKRQNVISTKAPLLFQSVRIVQNDQHIEVIDRSDSSFFPVAVKAIAPIAATPAAREQTLALLGGDKEEPTILRFEGSRMSFALNQKVTVTVDAPLETVPQGLDHIIASGDASQAFEAWVTHCRLFGEAVVEDGERVLFEVIPAKE